MVVVNCTFSNQSAINADNSGGRLILHADSADGFDTDLHLIDSFEVLTENPSEVNFTLFTSKPKYDYFYCGSPLYGGLSPERVREWIAYHVRFFGEKSHFVIHDVGGVHEEVLEVLKPWIELGYVTLQDVRDQERFDGYYHNQFMVVNDCLHRNKFMAGIYWVPEESGLGNLEKDVERRFSYALSREDVENAILTPAIVYFDLLCPK